MPINRFYPNPARYYPVPAWYRGAQSSISGGGVSSVDTTPGFFLTESGSGNFLFGEGGQYLAGESGGIETYSYPTAIQYAVNSTNNSSAQLFTLTLASTPTPGNELYLIATGAATSKPSYAFTVPTSWSEIGYNQANFQQAQVLRKVVSSGDGKTWVFSNATVEVQNLILIEFSSVQSYFVRTGNGFPSGNTLTTDVFSQTNLPTTVFIAIEQDQARTVSSITGTWSRYFEWSSTYSYPGNHSAVLLQYANSWGASFGPSSLQAAVTWSGAITPGQIYAALHLYGAP